MVEFKDINDQPEIDYDKCTGCGMCVAKCPGLACFVIDLTYSEDKALLKIPYEMSPMPEKKSRVLCLNRVGEVVSEGIVENITEPFKDSTKILHVSVNKALVDQVRSVRVVE